MLEREIIITNRKGLHARAAARLVGTTQAFRSEVFLIRDEQQINAKSILGLLMLGAHQGTVLTLRTVGSDEDAAMERICALIEANFEELD